MDKKLTTIVGEFIFGLDEASDINECFELLNKATEQLGFSGIVYSAIPIDIKPLANNAPVFLKSSGFSAKFLQHYEEANFAQNDFTIKQILNGDITPVNWWSEEKKGSLKQSEKHVIQVAREDYNIFNGISIPTLASSSIIAGASVISEEQNNFFSCLLNERLKTLKMLIKQFHQHIFLNAQYNKVFYLDILQNLTQKEKKVLEHIASGKVLKSIDGIGSSSAGNIRSRLFKKFGIQNANQLAYLLGTHKILQML